MSDYRSIFPVLLSEPEVVKEKLKDLSPELAFHALDKYAALIVKKMNALDGHKKAKIDKALIAEEDFKNHLKAQSEILKRDIEDLLDKWVLYLK